MTQEPAKYVLFKIGKKFHVIYYVEVIKIVFFEGFESKYFTDLILKWYKQTSQEFISIFIRKKLLNLLGTT